MLVGKRMLTSPFPFYIMENSPTILAQNSVLNSLNDFQLGIEAGYMAF